MRYMYQKNPAISKGIDWVMVWLYAILVCIGILCIFSVEFRSSDNPCKTFLVLKELQQTTLFLRCLFGACHFILLTDSKLFTAMANLSYLVGILLIIATFVVGKEIKGSRSWIPLVL